MSKLFSPLKLRELEFRNRVFVSPMCQYSCVDGVPTDWHLVHLGSRAVGGAGLVMVEATGVSPEARISPSDAGIWNDQQAKAFAPIAKFIREQGAAPAIQLAHAGRKASTNAPWVRSLVPLKEGTGGWTPLAPSAIPFDANSQTPKEMNGDDIEKVLRDFEAATRRSLAAGFEVTEVHAAHGYLLHEFLSPLSNLRKDEYGGSLENRMRLPLRVAKVVRNIWPAKWPVFVRISATDWAEGGWDIDQSVLFSKELKKIGIDLVDCSSGALIATAKIPVAPGYQVPFAETIRREAQIATGAVGLITEAVQAEEILASEKADSIFIARAMLNDPYWPLHAAHALGADISWPKQYGRGRPSR